MPYGRHAEAEVHALERHGVRHDLAVLGAERVGGWRHSELGQRRRRRNRAEESLHGLDDGRLVHVAGHGQDRVVRPVPGPEERGHVIEAGRVQVLHRADRRVVVGMLRREDRRHELLVERAVRPVVVALALLVLDHLALVVEVLLVERVEQRRHPVRLEPEADLDLVRRHRLEVVGAVEVGARVVDPAGPLHDGHVLGLPDVARALEHEVLEQVREAGLAGLLVLGADRVPEVDGHDRREPIGRHDQAQPVLEAVLRELDGGQVGDGIGHEHSGLGMTSSEMQTRLCHCRPE